MSKKTKKALPISTEILDAAEAIASIEGRTVTDIAERLLQDYIMENMSVLVGELNRLGNVKSEPVTINARSKN